MTILFASDVHLSDARPARVDAFERFLAGPCRRASHVYLLGDIFDAWLGDDDAREPHPRIEAALRELTTTGARVGICHGNHDFLLGDAFMQRTGCTLLAQPEVIDAFGHTTVLVHGDQLCTDDVEYQQWRAHFTTPANQAQFLALPFEQRLARAAALRLESGERTAIKAEDIMDVTAGAVSALLGESRATHLVHGHTHRPAIHRLGDGCERIVLGDWYRGDQVVCWDEHGPRLLSASTLDG